MFSQLKQGFDTVLIDEAAQAVEMSTLIPLKYACRRLILVGDPNQLPATVFSERSKEHNYEQSLFERLQKGRHAVTMLQTQYRMHPHISAFPSAHFYAGAIHDAPSVVSQPPRPWHARRCLAPYVFYDVADGHAEQSSSTWFNDLEAKLAVAIIEHLLTRHGESLSAKRSSRSTTVHLPSGGFVIGQGLQVAGVHAPRGEQGSDAALQALLGRLVLGDRQAGALGGLLASLANWPLPWMTGSLLAVILLRCSGCLCNPPPGSRQTGQLIVACAIGLHFTTPVFAQKISHLGLIVLGGLLGLAHGFFYPSFNALAVEGASPHDRGKIMAVFQAWFTAGGAFGTFFLGALAYAEGYPMVFEVVGLATFIALGILVVSPEGRAAFRR